MGLSELCIRRPVLTTLVTATFIVFGLFAYRLLAVAALPAVEFPTIVINTNLPGASAETMASSVAAPIERQLSTISGVSSLTSTLPVTRALLISAARAGSALRENRPSRWVTEAAPSNRVRIS